MNVVYTYIIYTHLAFYITWRLFSSSMVVVDGSFVFMGFSDNGEPLLTDPYQSCSSSCEPTPINLSTEAPIKKQK